MASPKDFIELLALFRVGLAVGLIDKSEVTKWADGIIMSEEEPDLFFIDLSLAKSKNEAISIISENVEAGTPINWKAVLGLLQQRMAEGQELKFIVKAMYHLLDEAELSELERDYIYTIEDFFEMANTKVYGSLDSIRQQTADFLSLYKDYTLANHPDWPELDKQANTGLEQMHRAAIERHEKEQRKPWWKKLW